MDPPTFAVLSDLGVAEGWRCWEVGAGGGSVARWLAARVGPHHGVNPAGEMWIAYRHTIQRLRARLTATGLVTDAQLDELEAAPANETLTCTFVAASVVSAWGRREGS